MHSAGQGQIQEARLGGRVEECALLDRLLGDVRHGAGRSLVLRGEAGIGKTALLEYLVESAADLTVVRAEGVESEMDLAYAGLHQLCVPMTDALVKLPAPQRKALETVFALSAGGAPDRFLVGLAVLSLLAGAAEQRALLCVVDDAQWLDAASALTLGFVARRLLAEPVGIVFAAREPSEELRHIPTLEVNGLPDDEARALLGAAVRARLDDRVRERVLAEARSDPRAAGREPGPDGQQFWRALKRCDEPARTNPASRTARQSVAARRRERQTPHHHVRATPPKRTDCLDDRVPCRI